PRLRPLSLRTALVPYTTLFRSFWHFSSPLSGRPGTIKDDQVRGRRSEPDRPKRGCHLSAMKAAVVHQVERDLPRGHIEMVPFEIDRKSTRLNSSHGSISYAVFC